MKLKLFLAFLVLLATPIAYGLGCGGATCLPSLMSTNQLVHWYRMNSSSLDYAYDNWGTFNLAQSNNPGKIMDMYGVANGSFKFIRASAQGVYSNDEQENLGFDADFTINIWVNFTSACQTVNTQSLFGLGNDVSALNYGAVQCYIANYMRFFLDPLGDGSTQTQNTYVGNLLADKWYMFTFIRNSTHMATFINGTLINSTELVSGAGDLGPSAMLRIGTNYAGGDRLDGAVSDVSFWNRSLTLTEIRNMYNSDSSSTPNWADPTPADNDRDNQKNKIINVTCATGNVFLWYGNLSNNASTLVLNGVSSPGTYNISNATTNSGTYVYKSACTGSANTTLRTFYYDTTTPTITLNPSNFFNFTNLSTASQYSGNLTLNITFSDPEGVLYGYEINITDASGKVVWATRNESLTVQNYTYNKTIETTNWTKDQRYKIAVFVSDSHTDLTIPNYIIKPISNGLDFKTDGVNSLKIYTSESATATTNKLSDRYEFTFSAIDKTIKDRVYYIESDHLTYLSSSKYPGHFIVGDGIRSGLWADFSGIDGEYKVEKITAKLYRITFFNSDPLMSFKSVGGLNIKNINYTWYLGQYNASVPVNVLSGNPMNLSLNITQDSTIIDIFAGLIFNNTYYSAIKTTGTNITRFIAEIPIIDSASNINYTYTWVVNYTQTGGINISFNTSTNKFILLSWGIDECTTYTNNLFNFTVLNEKTNTAFFSNVSFDFVYWVKGFSASNKTYQKSLTNITHTFCSNPANISFMANFNNIVAGTGYYTRTYKRINTDLTETIKAYLLAIESSTNSILFKIIDSSSSAVTNAIMQIYRNINGTSTLIHYATSDFAGQISVYLDQLYLYSFIINATGYPIKNFDLQPADPSLEYTIRLSQANTTFYTNTYEGIRYRITPSGLLFNVTNAYYQNITFEVDGSGLQEIGMNISNHPFVCIPANCFNSLTTTTGGNVTVAIKINQTGKTLLGAFYFQKVGGSKIYVNDRIYKAVNFIDIITGGYNMVSLAGEMRAGLTPDILTFIAGGVMVLAIALGSVLGLFGMFLMIPVIVLLIVFSLPGIAFLNPFVAMPFAIVGIFAVLLYALKGEG